MDCRVKPGNDGRRGASAASLEGWPRAAVSVADPSRLAAARRAPQDDGVCCGGRDAKHPVIPGCALLGAGPESLTPSRGYGFRVRAEDARPGMTKLLRLA